MCILPLSSYYSAIINLHICNTSNLGDMSNLFDNVITPHAIMLIKKCKDFIVYMNACIRTMNRHAPRSFEVVCFGKHTINIPWVENILYELKVFLGYDRLTYLMTPFILENKNKRTLLLCMLWQTHYHYTMGRKYYV